MITDRVEAVAELLAGAERDGIAVRQPEVPLSIDEAYAVQTRSLRGREARGERQVGVKLGFTSRAKMAQMGIDDVIVGFLTDAHHVGDGGDLSLAGLIHPRVEPEVAFRLARDVDTSDPADDLLSAVDAVAPALEIIDSRYRDFRFSLPAVIADNTSAARFAVGPWAPLPADLGDLDVVLEIDGTAAASGSTSAILGHPLEALRELRQMAERYGHRLRAGSVILAGAATAAVPMPTTGVVTARVAGLGEVGVRVVGGARGGGVDG